MTDGSADRTAGTTDETTGADEPPVIPLPLGDPAGETRTPAPSGASDEETADLDEDIDDDTDEDGGATWRPDRHSAASTRRRVPRGD